MKMVLKEQSEAALQAFGRKLARCLQSGDVVLLRGTLGAGKTTLIRAMIRAKLGEDTEVTSPTFTLLNHYPSADFDIWHYDLYRVESASELEELGLEEALDRGVLFIEWPDIAIKLLPSQRLEIMLDCCEGDMRHLILEGDETWCKRMALLSTSS
jgi:tRNA threonylcarbamoyl adenosine modification protein YjeE